MDQQPLFIVFIQLGLGGVERKIVDIANFLKTYKPNLHIYILLRKSAAFSVQNQIINKQVTVITYTDWMRVKIPFFFVGFVLFHVWKLKPKAILSFLDMPTYAAILAKILFFWRKTKVIVGSDHYASRVISTYNYPKLRLLLVKNFYPLANKIFTCTEATKNDLIHAFSIQTDKIRVLKNWTTVSRQQLRPKIIYDLIYVGRLEREKDVMFLLDTFKTMISINRSLTMIIVGDGSQKTPLQKFVKTNKLSNNVLFTGAVENVKEYIKKAHICVYAPTMKADGFPIALLEAMATGAPVLTRYFDGSDEVIQSGINGCIVHSKKEFIQKTLWLLKHPKVRKQIALQAKEYVAKHHAPANMQAYFDELKI